MGQAIGYREYKPLLDCFVYAVLTALQENVVSMVLYGSVARGTAEPASDVDLLLILEQAPPSYRDRLGPFLPILQRLRDQACWKALEDRGVSPSLSVLVLSREEADQNRRLYLDMIEEAQILVDRGGFFQHRLDRLQRRLGALGARKVRRGETWYWDLKPDLRLGEVVIL